MIWAVRGRFLLLSPEMEELSLWTILSWAAENFIAVSPRNNGEGTSVDSGSKLMHVLEWR
jgi:hypothetical protein